MKKIFAYYFDTFKGLSKEIWWLSLITFINRAGTMVIPFLSLYLTESMGFRESIVGWIMSCFGLGSVVGSWLGGKITERIGYYRVMNISLFLTGILFVILQYVSTLAGFCIGIFLVMLVADTFRPAIFVAMSAYSTQENKTRSVTLVRLAINLGFTAGPAIGGLIIANIGYSGLFWVDGITCVLAVILMTQVLHPRKSKPLDDVKVENPVSVYKDKPFWIFFIAMAIFGFVFLQYFSTMPLFYRDIFALKEYEIGMLLGLNGLIIVLLEMPLIKWLENTGKSKVYLMMIGLVLTGLSFVTVLVSPWIGVLTIGMIFMTVGEMIAFPFSNSFVIDRAKKGKQGEYMALYVISMSISHVFGHNVGLHMIDYFGFYTTWTVISILSLVGVFILIYLIRVLRIEKLKSI